MSKFPSPIKLPTSVPHARKRRKDDLIYAAARGIGIRLAIVLIELYGVIAFGSSALLMDALSSLIDIFSSLFLIFCIRLAKKPPDRNHPFGHGRFEPLAGLVLGLFLVMIGGGMFAQEAFQLTQPVPKESINAYLWLIPFGAVILLEFCYQFMMRFAKKHNSPALAADAIHYRIDGLTSLFAALALLVASFYPQASQMIDQIGALMIAALMLVIGCYAVKANLDQVVDKAPEPEFFRRIRKAACLVEGVRGTEKIRIQLYGPDAHVNIDVEVDPQLNVEAAHKISQKVRAEIQKEWPAVLDVSVHIEPYYPGDHQDDI